VKIPVFLLRRLYVPGSLRNTRDGWEFQLHNSIAGGEATGLDPLVVDGAEIPLEDCSFDVDGVAVSFAEVGPQRRFGLESGRDIRLAVRGEPLAVGEHTVQMGFTVPGIGHLAFDFTDSVP
jgi:hypothetical protein